MGLHQCMRSSTGVFSAWVGVLLLGLTLAQSTPPQPFCPGVVPQYSLIQPNYHNKEMDKETGFMTELVQSFLNTVQPNPIPKDLFLKLSNDFGEVLEDPDFIKEALQYEVGFLVCAAIGILYILLMPIVGFFLMCCRCCGNCGGQMHQKQTSSIHCRRRALYWSSFITTVIILAGNICMFRSNGALNVSVDQGTAEVDNSIVNLNTFLKVVPQQIDYVVNEGSKTIDVVTGNLNTIGAHVGAQIQDSFRGTFDKAKLAVRRMDQDTVKASNHLYDLSTDLARLQTSMDLLQANATTVENQIKQTLSSPHCNACFHPELQELNLIVNISLSSSSLGDLQSAVDDVKKANLQSKIKEGEDYFNSIPQRITSEAKDAVESIKHHLIDVRSHLDQVTSNIHGHLSALTTWSDRLHLLQRNISNVTPEVERAEHIRWGICLALCCLVLLVVVCNVLGLVLGPLGLRPIADPTERSCTSNCGGLFLLIASGLIFIFCWLFMLLVLLLFLLGGNAFTLICRPWNNGNLLKFLDTPGLIPGFELGSTLQVQNLTFTSIYSDCEKDKSLWSILHLNESIDLEDLLNVTKYTEDIEKYIENADISLPAFSLLSPEIQKQLDEFSTKATDVNVTIYAQQIDQISKIDLNSTAYKIEALAAVQTNPDVQKELKDEAFNLRRIQTNIETNIFPQIDNLNSSMVNFQSQGENIQGAVEELLNTSEAVQDLFNTNAIQIVGTEVRKFMDCQVTYIISYADWINPTITKQVGRCGPVAAAVDTMEAVLCSHMVDSLNAFWFSLGWCIIFFIPSIIFSVKLAKYYRRMKDSDITELQIQIQRSTLTGSSNQINEIAQGSMKSF